MYSGIISIVYYANRQPQYMSITNMLFVLIGYWPVHKFTWQRTGLDWVGSMKIDHGQVGTTLPYLTGMFKYDLFIIR